ncbi:MAG: InlB B-repeat-containing protein, partial [Paludibacteraceae bacterium]|nr:InlB B-repeat-containing protein [Paludibacteraceae bacterium]
MKNFTKQNFKTNPLWIRLLIMAFMLLAGVGNLSAAGQYNIHWNGKVYFLAPETWDVDKTYKYIQVDITRTTDATSSNHQEYIGNMTRLGTSRLFYVSVNANHYNWNQNEFIAFTANDHNYGSGSFRIDNNHYYTTPLDYGVKDGGYYLFKPNSKTELQTTTNANKITGIWASSRDDFKVDQTVQIYTNGSSSATGGTVKLTGYYLSNDNALSSSSVTSSSTSAKYGSVPGTEMKLTATAKTGYKFDGWYTAATSGTKLSSDATYTYNVYEETTVYARFLSQEYTITYKDQGNVAFSGTHASGYPKTHTYGTDTTLDSPTKTGYTFEGWFTDPNCTGTKVTSLGATAYSADITLYAKWEKICVPATSITSAELQQDGTIKLEGDFTTCGAKYHGFQWRKSTADWCDDGDESQDFSNYVKIGDTEGGEGEVKDFTPKSGVTYVFRTYIYNNGSWIYSSETIKVSTCVTVEEPNITSNSPICLGSGLTLTLNERQDGVVYKIGNQEIFTEGNNKYSFVPQASGTGSLTVVASHTNACSGTSYPKEIQYTVNTLPSVPILTTGSTNVCPGTVTLANFKAMAEQNTVVWYSNQECTKEVTTPTVEKGGRYTFYAKSKNASGCFSEGYSTLEVNVYDDPKDFTLTAFPTEICSGADVEISISNKQDGVTYKFGEEIINESITVYPTDDTEYTVTAYLNACPTLIRSKSIGVITVHPIPSFTVDPTNLSLCKGSTSVTDLTELSHVVIENGDPVWYDAETAGNVVTTGADLENGGTYWVAAENNETGCVNTKRKSFTLKIYDLPKYPDLTKTSAVVCQADETVNLNTLAGVNDVIWYQGEDEVQKPDEISIDEEGIFTYTAKAVNANGCQSATGVDFKLTVNPLPTITSISASNDKPVPFEDVVLTANDVTSGATVKWYEGGVEKATGTTYVVTSSSDASKTVTAKAFLNGCESAEVSKKVTFSAEDCSSTITTTTVRDTDKMQILCREDGSSAKSNLKCYAFDKNKEEIFGSWDNAPTTNITTQIGGKTYRVWTIENISTKYTTPISVIFYYDGKQTEDLETGDPGYAYKYWYKAADSNNKSSNGAKEGQGSEITKTITTTTPAPITAPAVKTVSVTSDEDGNVTMVGQVV